MSYQYGEPVRAQDGVLFRVENHGQQSYLFKVGQPALEYLAMVSADRKNPLDPVNRGYTAQLPHSPANADGHMDTVDVFNKYRDVIHKAAVSMLTAGMQGDPIEIPVSLLEREYTNE
jgi:hypothetical protein